MAWTIGFHEAARSEYLDLPAELQARLERITVLIEAHGLEHLPGKFARHIEGRLWEFRLKGKDGIARALYVTVSGRRIVIVRVFVKKTQKTPRRVIQLALERAEEIA
jgi:phage-related protein